MRYCFIDFILNFFNWNHIVCEYRLIRLLNVFLVNLEFFSDIVNKVLEYRLQLGVQALQKFEYENTLFVLSLIFEPEGCKLEFKEHFIWFLFNIHHFELLISLKH